MRRRVGKSQLIEEGKVIEKYLESYIFNGYVPKSLATFENLEIILTFLISEKRILKSDLQFNMYNVLREFKLVSFMEGKLFSDHDVKKMLARVW